MRSGSAWFLSLSLCAACTPGSRSAATRAVCGLVPQAPDVASALSIPAYPSEACVDAVLDDLAADVPALLDDGGLDDPYGLVHGEDLGDTELGALLSAAHALLVLDLGDVADARGRWVRGAFAEALDRVARRTGASDASAALYDYVADEIAETTVGVRPDASAGLRGGRLMVFDLEGGLMGAGVLVHEARHRRGPDHLVCGGEPICDVDASGSYGFEIAVHELALRATDDDLLREVEQRSIDALAQRILDEPPPV